MNYWDLKILYEDLKIEKNDWKKMKWFKGLKKLKKNKKKLN